MTETQTYDIISATVWAVLLASGPVLGVALAALSFVCLWVIRDATIAGKLLALAASDAVVFNSPTCVSRNSMLPLRC